MERNFIQRRTNAVKEPYFTLSFFLSEFLNSDPFTSENNRHFPNVLDENTLTSTPNSSERLNLPE